MPNLNNRLFDQIVRFIERHLRFEICAVDRVRWHKSPWPGDRDMNVCDVVIRDRADRESDREDIDYVRYRCVPLQQYTGRFFGTPWTPRRGDLVKVWFYQRRKGIILGTVSSYGNEPVCRPDPYTLREKICQYRPHIQDSNLDFPDKTYQYPDGRKPTCLNWHHGPCNGDFTDDRKEPTVGRDWWQVWDYCQQGDRDPTCKDCTDIDYPQRKMNTWRKVYSRNTLSCESPNARLEDHVACGSYHRFESECGQSKEYSEGIGHIREGNAVGECDKRGHINFKGNTSGGAGTIDIHAAHEEVAFASESEGARMSVVHNEDSSVAFAYEAIYFDQSAYIRIMKDGQIIISTPEKVTVESTGDEVEISAATKITLDAPLVHVTDDHQIDGVCDHGPCSCIGGGLGSGWST